MNGPDPMLPRFDKAIALIDAANGEDPNKIETEAGERPAERVYAERMSEALERFCPDAPEELRLAARAQHLRRWTLPRAEFPQGRKGYHAWRNAAKHQHAEAAEALLSRAGYGSEAIARVQALIRKERLKRDPDAQTLEDVACLVFLEHYFSAFAVKHDRGKLIGIVRKTWGKMSAKARAAAMTLPLDGDSRALVEQALGSAE